MLVFDRAEWQGHALCRGMGTALFFPERGEPTARVKALCSACPVRVECGEAGRKERFGIWGGHAERGRRGLRREAVA